MKKGQIVNCARFKQSDCEPYLTNGKNYIVSAGEGDEDMFGDVIDDPSIFEVKDDVGDTLFNYTLNSSHAVWELVS